MHTLELELPLPLQASAVGSAAIGLARRLRHSRVRALVALRDGQIVVETPARAGGTVRVVVSARDVGGPTFEYAPVPGLTPTTSTADAARVVEDLEEVSAHSCGPMQGARAIATSVGLLLALLLAAGTAPLSTGAALVLTAASLVAAAANLAPGIAHRVADHHYELQLDRAPQLRS